MTTLKPVDALMEVGCEEIPARFMNGLLEELKNKTQEKLTENRITYARVRTIGTPRRLTVVIEDISRKQPDSVEELQGPPAEIAFDKENKPTAAAVGFAKKNGIPVTSLKIKNVGGRNYVSATLKKKGGPTDKLLRTLFPQIISSLYLPLAMRWGDREFKFVRPIHWIAALFGEKIVPFELAGIRSSNITRGHRFFRNPKTEIRNPNIEDYKKVLKRLDVIADQNERKEMVRKEVSSAAKKAGGQALIEDDLLNEVTFLLEKPKAYVGKFNEDFLALPSEVLITSMKKNQKYFPILDAKGKLTSRFVLVTNDCTNKNIVDGNQKVITARLSDAMFFFTEDRKLPLKMRVPDLKRVEYFEKLGNMFDKTERLKKLSVTLARHLKLDEDQCRSVAAAAELSKADLITHMVFEFPELQGVMGREYSIASGETREVGAAIFEHYLPRSADDRLPQTPAGIALSLADKIDSLAGCFSIGKIPTGSEDPYGLRRAAYGIVKIVLDKKLDLMLDEMFDHALNLYAREGVASARVIKQLLEFIGGRVKIVLLDEKIPSDVAEAVLSEFNDILEAREMAAALVADRREEWFAGVAATHSRISRIAKGAKREQVIEADLADPEEIELNKLYLSVNWEVSEKVNAGNYKQALLELARLTVPVEAFFKKVLVLCEDERLRANRLALLRSIEKTFLKVADFTKLQS
ncbi:MAG TPA: glycine--tRNA ligase subunit beta [Candidatus Omnitrophota bacterium]|nr:glycine--tRNA ligase subunit beta [Candidatus Omnitrophota bacterium]